MRRRLRTYVHVDGVAYGPDDKVPAAVAKRIGDHAWTDGADTAPEPEFDEDDGETSDGGTPDPPPRMGRGSGLGPWQRFAGENGVGIDSDMSRDDVIEACENAGVIDREE